MRSCVLGSPRDPCPDPAPGFIVEEGRDVFPMIAQGRGVQWFCRFSVEHLSDAWRARYGADRYTPQAAPARQAEFTAGRYCAWRALQHLDHSISPLLSARRDRTPVWPPGVVGSITHSRDCAAACVAEDLASVGIDIEHILSEKQAKRLESRVLTPLEKNNPPAALPFHVYLTLVFSLKESAYKAIYPQCRLVMGFHQAAVLEWDWTQQRCCLAITHPDLAERDWRVLPGKFVISAGRVHSAVWRA